MRKIFLRAVIIILLAATIMGLYGCKNENMKKPEYEKHLDFVLDVESGRDVKILQLTDTQIIDASQKRTSDRLTAAQDALWAKNTEDDNCFKYIRNSIEQAKPDLIVLTGDNVYGEFDDSGSSLTALITHMDSYKIPWAIAWGNHDNESAKGIDWQCKQLEDAQYCLFERGTVTGNSNYTIGIVQDKKLIRVLYLLDSNGCINLPESKINFGKVFPNVGFQRDQLEWLRATAQNLETATATKTPSSLFFHISTNEYGLASKAAGYEILPSDLYTIGTTVEATNNDFGSKNQHISEHTSSGFLQLLKDNNFDSTFAGHDHKINTSILYEGIRWTFGLKTGKYDAHTPDELGGTLLETSGKNFLVRHIYFK